MYSPSYNHDTYMTVPKLGNSIYRYGLKERIMELKDYSNRAFSKNHSLQIRKFQASA